MKGDGSRKRVLFVASRESTYSRVSIIGTALTSASGCSSIVSEHRSYLRRIYDVLVEFASASKDVDVVVLGYMAQPIVPFVLLCTRRPIIADMYLSLYDTIIQDRRLAPPGSLLSRMCWWLDALACTKCDRVLADTGSNAGYLTAMFGARPGSVTVVPIGADQTIFTPRLEAQLGRQFRVLFYGSFIPLQGVEIIVQAAKLLDKTDVTFDLVGSGQTEVQCRQLAAELRPRNVRFYGWRSQQEIVKMAHASHVLLGIFGVTDKTRRVIPNKVFEGLALRVPLVTADTPALRELFTPGLDLFAVPAGNAAALAAELESIVRNYEHANQIAENGYFKFCSVASLTCLRKKMSGVLNTVGCENRKVV